MTPPPPNAPKASWPDYAAVWRWHFYAGLFCLPFFAWLALTGSAYLFRPEIEALLDRPYEGLRLAGARPAPSQEVAAALAAMPGAAFSRYEPPATGTGAAQVVLMKDGHPWRVIVDPRNLKPMHIGRDDHRPMELISHLHGQLLLGDRGSNLVELAGSWGVVMIVTGLFLWWPRASRRLGGLVYPRIALRGRALLRDLHAVTGLWISAVTLFLLLTGLPWSSFWGSYLTWARNHWTITAGAPDWSLGGNAEPLPQFTPSSTADQRAAMSAAEMAAMMPQVAANGAADAPVDFSALNRIVPVVARLNPPRPIWILPPQPGSTDWIVWSRTQNRPLRVAYMISPVSGAVTGTKHFADDDAVNRAINIAIAAHEGQLFGRANQAILLLNALGVLLVSVSAAIMWWRRRPAHQLGAPMAGARPRYSAGLVFVIVVLGVLLPEFGASLAAVLAIDLIVLPRLPAVATWLGRRPMEGARR